MSVQENVRTVEVFDPAMCCSTGVCGPSVDPALARFAGDLEWLQGQGVAVHRYNLAQEPGAFAVREAVTAALRDKGEQCLPLVFVDGQLASEAGYPAREELAQMAGVHAPERAESVWAPTVKELVAIAAAVASNCESCLEHHVGVARELGVGDDDIARTVRTAKAVKETPAQSTLQAADRLLGVSVETPLNPLPVVNGSGKCC
jgi:AhpD family alkylhydroperoxidase